MIGYRECITGGRGISEGVSSCTTSSVCCCCHWRATEGSSGGSRARISDTGSFTVNLFVEWLLIFRSPEAAAAAAVADECDWKNLAISSCLASVGQWRSVLIAALVTALVGNSTVTALLATGWTGRIVGEPLRRAMSSNSSCVVLTC